MPAVCTAQADKVDLPVTLEYWWLGLTSESAKRSAVEILVNSDLVSVITMIILSVWRFMNAISINESSVYVVVLEGVRTYESYRFRKIIITKVWQSMTFMCANANNFVTDAGQYMWLEHKRNLNFQHTCLIVSSHVKWYSEVWQSIVFRSVWIPSDGMVSSVLPLWAQDSVIEPLCAALRSPKLALTWRASIRGDELSCFVRME